MDAKSTILYFFSLEHEIHVFHTNWTTTNSADPNRKSSLPYVMNTNSICSNVFFFIVPGVSYNNRFLRSEGRQRVPKNFVA